MAIYGLSDYKRLPRLGKIKLGKKLKTAKGTEYPVQTRYFVCPEEIQAVYGPEPVELDIMFPLDEIEIIFPQYLKLYGKTGLKCKGDGRDASMMVAGKIIEKTCTPGARECAGCKPIGTLNVIMPNVPGFGVWQIWTSSWNSIVNLNSSIDMIKAMTGGKIAFIPLKLQLQEHNATVTKPDGTQFQKKVYVMNLNISQTMGEFHNQYSLEAQHQRALQNPGYAGLAHANNILADMTAKQLKKPQIELMDDEDEWEDVVETDPIEEPVQVDMATERQIRAIYAGANNIGISKDDVKKWASATLQKDIESMKEITKEEASALISEINRVQGSDKNEDKSKGEKKASKKPVSRGNDKSESMADHFAFVGWEQLCDYGDMP